MQIEVSESTVKRIAQQVKEQGLPGVSGPDVVIRTLNALARSTDGLTIAAIVEEIRETPVRTPMVTIWPVLTEAAHLKQLNEKDEVCTTLLNAANVRIERIVSHGHASSEGFWYDQDEHEWVIVLQGAARLRFEDSVLEMKTGDSVDIPAHKKHRVEWTTPDEKTIWLAVFYKD